LEGEFKVRYCPICGVNFGPVLEFAGRDYCVGTKHFGQRVALRFWKKVSDDEN